VYPSRHVECQLSDGIEYAFSNAANVRSGKVGARAIKVVQPIQIGRRRCWVCGALYLSLTDMKRPVLALIGCLHFDANQGLVSTLYFKIPPIAAVHFRHPLHTSESGGRDLPLKLIIQK
jgi:hypothetical protein